MTTFIQCAVCFTIVYGNNAQFKTQLDGVRDPTNKWTTTVSDGNESDKSCFCKFGRIHFFRKKIYWFFPGFSLNLFENNLNNKITQLIVRLSVRESTKFGSRHEHSEWRKSQLCALNLECDYLRWTILFLLEFHSCFEEGKECECECASPFNNQTFFCCWTCENVFTHINSRSLLSNVNGKREDERQAKDHRSKCNVVNFS